MATQHEFGDAVLTLENDRAFSDTYRSNRDANTREARGIIRGALERNGLSIGTLAFREDLRRRFDDNMSIWDRDKDDAILFSKHPYYTPGCSIHTPSASSTPAPKDTAMNANITITITTPTLVNGRDVAGMSDAQVYDLIRQAEREIADLSSIANKPARLVKAIADKQAGIDALVAAVNARDAKDEPTPTA